jgi:hypothetical protein
MNEMMVNRLGLIDDGAQLQAIVVSYLSANCRGRARGMHAEILARKLSIAERRLRSVINAAREEGIAIVGTPETGYFVAETAEELEEGCAFLRSRAMNSLRAEARMRKISLPALLGQLQVQS